MKRIVLLIGLAGWMFCLGVSLAWILLSSRAPIQQAEVMPRRTTLTDSEGNLINYFSVQNLDVVGGEATIDVKTLTPDVTQNSWDSRPIGFRNHSGTWEFQNYSGEWKIVGDVDILQPSVMQLSATDDRVVGLRNNAGVWQFANYSSEWRNVGQGSEVQYALDGNGSGVLAQGTFVAPTGIIAASSLFSIYGVVAVRQWDRAESFYAQIDEEYSKTVVDFGKDANGYLTLIIGEETYVSDNQVFTASTNSFPKHVGVVAYDDGGGNWRIYFIANDFAEGSNIHAPTFPNISSTYETHQLGAGLDGSIFYLAVTNDWQMGEGAEASYMNESLAQCKGCRLLYQLTEGHGATVTNRVDTWFQNITTHPLTVADGTWVTYENGY